MSTDKDPEFRPKSRVDTSKLIRRNETRNYKSPNQSDSSDSDTNFSMAGNLDVLFSDVVDDSLEKMGDQNEAIQNIK